MSEHEVKDSQKTVVAFIAGLLIGGLLVWIFADTPAEAPSQVDDADAAIEADDESDDAMDAEGSDETADTTEVDTTPTLEVGDAAVSLANTSAGNLVSLESATFPTDAGWIAVRTYRDGQLGNILGASEYSREAGLTPEIVRLLAPTVAGREYAIVFFSQDSNPAFNLDGDAQLDTEIITFTAE